MAKQSKWKKLAAAVAPIAPLLGTALGGPAGGLVASMVANKLGVVEDEDNLARAITDDINGESKRLKQLEDENRRALKEMVALAVEVNKTMRVEAKSDDPFVRRWRPFFGYTVAGTWALQFLTLLGCFAWATWMSANNNADSGKVVFDGAVAFIQASLVMWSVALPILGVSIHSRSKDKARANGVEPKGILHTLASKVQSN